MAAEQLVVPDVSNVLVPLDGSELALQVMPTARVLAQRFDATLSTISVAASDKETDLGRARVYGAAALDVDPGDDRVCVRTEGEVAQVIGERAAELGGTVVCMATHGRGRVSGAFIGSAARSVVEASPDPVIVLGPAGDNPGWSPRPRDWPEPLSVPRVVACVDGSEDSEQVLPFAAGWAQALGMSLTVLTSEEDTPEPLRPESVRSPYGTDVDAQAYVDALVERWRPVIGAIEGVVTSDPISPAGGVQRYLDQRPAGLVALTTHARSGMTRAKFGATAASIVAASVAPCLVAPVRT